MEMREKKATFRQNMKAKGYRALNIFVPSNIACAITEFCSDYGLTQGQLLTCFVDFLASKAHREIFAPTAKEVRIKNNPVMKKYSALPNSPTDFDSGQVTTE